MTTSSISSCSHVHHFFSNPLCPTLSWCERIGYIVFHILTFCIPLFIYLIAVYVCRCFEEKRVGDSRRGSFFPPPPPIPPEPPAIIDPSLRAPPRMEIYVLDHSDFTKAVLGIARDLLAEHLKDDKYGELRSDMREFRFFPGALPPVNEEISCLGYLYKEVYYPVFQDIMMTRVQNSSWDEISSDDMKVLELTADLAFALSVLMLEDIDEFIEKHDISEYDENENDDFYVSLEEALMDSKYYMSQLLYELPILYYQLRSGVSYQYDGQQWVTQKCPRLQEGSALFYQDKTVQNHWRFIYNDYCDLLGRYVNKESLGNGIIQWTQLDTSLEDYVTPVPDDGEDNSGNEIVQGLISRLNNHDKDDENAK